MNIMITGGTGFIGSHLAQRFSKEGHKVVLYDLNTGWYPEIKDENISFVQGCVTNKPLMKHVLKDDSIDYMFFLAGVSHTVASALGSGETVKSGAYGLTCTLDASLDTNLKRTYIASSSLCSTLLKDTDGIVRAGETVVDTAQCYHPYSTNKMCMEMLLRDYADVYGKKFTILRYSTQYGPRMAKNVVTWYFVKNALTGNPMVINGDGSQWRQHEYIDDTVEAHVKALANPRCENKVCYVVPNWKTSVKQMAEGIQYWIPQAKIEYAEKRKLDIRVKFIDPKETEEMLDWKATTSFKDGVKRTLDWYDHRFMKSLPIEPIRDGMIEVGCEGGN